MPIDLSSLPEPQIIEQLSFEDILADVVADVVQRFEEAGIDYDVGNLETDPVKIILETVAYRIVLERARINDAARANLVAKAVGADLVNLAAFYGVEPMDGETSEALRARIVLAIAGRSTAGPEEWYEFHARSADARIKAARVYRMSGGPKIGIALLSKVDGGVPDDAMLQAVTEAVNARNVRVLSDVVVVEAATQQTQTVAAQVWLLPGTPHAVFEGLEERLLAAWSSESGMGFDLNPSWIAAKLHASGVAKVVVLSPAASVVVPDNRAVVLGTVTLTNMGPLR